MDGADAIDAPEDEDEALTFEEDESSGVPLVGTPSLPPESPPPRNQDAKTPTASPSPSFKIKPMPRVPLRLKLREVELQKLHRLDVANQTFQATIWMEFVMPDGALDENLVSGMLDRPPTSHFPIGEDGRPTFRPSATWYMDQLDVRNALNWKRVDGKIMQRPQSNDLIMAIRVEGTFTEVYELKDYPFDVQGLSMTLVFNCRANGPLPMDIIVDQSARQRYTNATQPPNATRDG